VTSAKSWERPFIAGESNERDRVGLSGKHRAGGMRHRPGVCLGHSLALPAAALHEHHQNKSRGEMMPESEFLTAEELAEITGYKHL
jgi:hypothetical protein